MKSSLKPYGLTGAMLLAGLCSAPQLQAASALADFQFNEGPNSTTVSSKVNGLIGTLGRAKDPANDPVITPDSPSGQAGDTSVSLNGTGFLVVDDSTNSVLAVQTNAFTIEVWAKVDLASTATFSGLAGYGSSYKLGFMNGELIFTLFRVVDIHSGFYVPPGEWHHLAAAWQPGVGVTFYYDGVATAVAETNSFVPPSNNLLGIGAEQLDNAFMGSLDRFRIHKAFLTESQLDSVAATPKAPLGSTVVAYNFNDTALPCQSAVSPARPAISSEDYFSAVSRPSFSTDTPSGASGDYSLNFTAGTYVLVPDANNVIALDAANPNFTLEAWLKFGALPQPRSVLFGYNGPGGAFSFSLTVDRHLFVTTYGIADTSSKAVIPDDGIWHHVAVVHENGKELRFYVDGVLGDTVAYTGGLLVGVRTDTTLVIGAEPGLYNPYAGLMDRVRITSAALNPDQLDYLAIPGVNPSAPTLNLATMLEVSWPTVPAGYKLQSTTNVDDPASWSFVTNAPYASGGKYLLYVPSTVSKVFYRLIKP